MDLSRIARGAVMLFDLFARTMVFSMPFVCLPRFSVVAGSLQISKAWAPEAQIGGDAPLLMTIGVRKQTACYVRVAPLRTFSSIVNLKLQSADAPRLTPRDPIRSCRQGRHHGIRG